MAIYRELLDWISTLKHPELRRKCSRHDCPALASSWRAPQQDGIIVNGEWFCGPECFERGLSEGLRKLLAASAPAPAISYRIPLGLLMLSRGMVDHASLRSALDAQRKAGEGKIGGWLRQLARLSESDLVRALGAQWACPALLADQHIEAIAGLLPQRLLEVHQMIPVRWTPDPPVLYLGFTDHVDYRVLYAVEQMLACETRPCVVPESALQRHLPRMRPQSEDHGGEIVFAIGSPVEMARISRSYAVELSATAARYSLCGRHVWVRLSNHQTTDLLFEVG